MLYFICVILLDKLYQIPVTYHLWLVLVKDIPLGLWKDDLPWQATIDRDVIRENKPDHIAYISLFELYVLFFYIFSFDRLSFYTFHPRFTRSSRLPVVREYECSVLMAMTYIYVQVAQGALLSLKKLRICQIIIIILCLAPDRPDPCTSYIGEQKDRLFRQKIQVQLFSAFL